MIAADRAVVKGKRSNPIFTTDQNEQNDRRPQAHPIHFDDKVISSFLPIPILRGSFLISK
jgi:hypothetical protein